MSAPTSTDRAAQRRTRHRSEAAGAGLSAPWSEPRRRSLFLGPGWRPALVFALTAGGLGGLLPVATLDEPGIGTAAAAARGWVAACALGLLWIPPLIATILCHEVELGVGALRFTAGARPRELRRRRRVEALTATALVASTAAAMGAVGGALVCALTPARWSPGLAQAPSGAELIGATVSAIAVLALATAVSEASRRRHAAAVLMSSTLVATLALLAVLYFAPALRPAQALSPWIGVWPMRRATARSPLLASDLPPAAASLITALWIAGAAVAAALANRSEQPPEPRDGDPG